MPQYGQEKEKKYCMFTIWPCPKSPNARNPAPGGLKITIFVDSYLVTIIIYLEEEKRIFKEIKWFSLYGFESHAPAQFPAPGVMKFTIFVDSSLVIISINLVCMDHAPKYRRIFFKEIHQFYTFTPKFTPLELGEV